MANLTTAQMKALYRKAVAGYRRETDNPIKKEMYLRASFALKVDLARRIRFKSKTGGLRSFWKRCVRTIEVYSLMNEPYNASQEAKMIKGDTDEECIFDDGRSSSIKRLRGSSTTDV